MDIDNSFEFCMKKSRKQMVAEEGCGMRKGVFVVVVLSGQITQDASA